MTFAQGNAALAPGPNRPMLFFGSRGPTVTDLQTQLNAGGAELDADGVFGGMTRAAVVTFQREQGLGVDGVVGPQTWGALDASPTPATTKQPPAHRTDKQTPGPDAPDGAANPVTVFVSGRDAGGVPDFGAPVAGATVELLHPDGTVATTGVSGADGRVTLQNTVQGPGTIRASKGGRTWADDYPMLHGLAETGIILAEANPVTIFVSGRDAGGVPDFGAPVAGATVELLQPDGTVATTGISGADGRVTLQNTVRGAGKIRATKDDRTWTDEYPMLDGLAETGIVLAAANPVTVFVSGRDAGGVPDFSVPVDGATVELLHPDGTVATTGVSGSDGKVLLQNTVRGAGKIRATKDGRTWTDDYPMLDGLLETGIVLADANPVTVFVSGRDAGGVPDFSAPVSGANVELLRSDGSPAVSGISGSDGKVLLQNTVRGAGKIRATKGDLVHTDSYPMLDGLLETGIVLRRN